MRNTETQTPNLVWDCADVLTRVDNDRELLHEILGIFKEDFPPTLAALMSAVQSQDLRSASALSHKLKGMLSNLGGVAAAAAAAKLESLASAKDVASLPDALLTLDRASSDLIHEVDAYLAEVRG